MHVNVDLQKMWSSASAINSTADKILGNCTLSLCKTNAKEMMADADEIAAKLATIWSLIPEISRTRRENGFGDWLGNMFGILTEKDKTTLESEIRISHEGTNKLVKEARISQNAFNDILSTFKSDEEKMGEIISIVNKLSADEIAEEHLVELKTISRKLKYLAESTLEAISDGKIHGNLLDPKKLDEMWSSLRENLRPGEKFAASNALTILSKENLMFSRKGSTITISAAIPVVDQNEFKIYKIMTAPVQIDDKIIMLHAPNEFLVVNEEKFSTTIKSLDKFIALGDVFVGRITSDLSTHLQAECFSNAFFSGFVDEFLCREFTHTAKLDKPLVVKTGLNEVKIFVNKPSNISMSCDGASVIHTFSKTVTYNYTHCNTAIIEGKVFFPTSPESISYNINYTYSKIAFNASNEPIPIIATKHIEVSHLAAHIQQMKDLHLKEISFNEIKQLAEGQKRGLWYSITAGVSSIAVMIVLFLVCCCCIKI
jgi:hypothetical protein